MRLIIIFDIPKRFFMQSETIENYLKAIYHLSQANTSLVTNKVLADRMQVTPGTVSESLRKLHDLKLVDHEKSYGARLTTAGVKAAVIIVRRHRIWETYLVNELGFGWDEVHEIAEGLEHIKSDKLIKKLSEKLGHPAYDPHGDPIPDEQGKIEKAEFIKLTDAKISHNYKIAGVADHSPQFLKYLDKTGLTIGSEVKVLRIESFDNSMQVQHRKTRLAMSEQVCRSLLVRKQD